jgi:hypothetical protein
MIAKPESSVYRDRSLRVWVRRLRLRMGVGNGVVFVVTRALLSQCMMYNIRCGVFELKDSKEYRLTSRENVYVESPLPPSFVAVCFAIRRKWSRIALK